MTPVSRPSPLPLLLASLISLAWIGGIGWLLLGNGLPEHPIRLVEILVLLIAPVAVPFAIVAALAQRRTIIPVMAIGEMENAEERFLDIASRIATVREHLDETTGHLAASGETAEQKTLALQQMAETVAARSDEAAGQCSALVQQMEEANRLADRFLERVGESAASASAEAGSLSDAATALAGHIADIERKGREIGREMDVTLSQLETRGREHAALLEAAGKTLQTASDTTCRTLATEVEEAQSRLAGHIATIEQRVGETRKAIEALAQAGAEATTGRLGMLATQLHEIEGRIRTQEEAGSSLGTAAMQSLQRLEARLSHSEETGKAALGRLMERIAETGSAISAFSPALQGSEAMVGTLGRSLSELLRSGEEAAAFLSDTLPERASGVGGIAEQLLGHLDGLKQKTADLEGRIAGLGTPIAEHAERLAAVEQALSRQSESLGIAGEALIVELEQARQLMSGVEESARETTLAAAGELVDTVSRVNTIASQASGRLRAMLAEVVDEAKTALSDTASRALADHFMTPLAQRTEEATALAGRAAERTASSMAALAETIALLDRRSADQLAALEESEQRHLLKSASLLGQRLDRSAEELARAAAIPEGGERRGLMQRLFGRFPATELSPLAEELAANADLRASVEHYSRNFEALLKRVEGHGVLESALRQSEEGQLATTLRAALDQMDRASAP